MSTDKPFINVGTLGHVDHGKTTLTAAITKVAGTPIAFANIDKTPEERKRGVTINATVVPYETNSRKYGHVDCPGHADYVKNMITGASTIQIAMLVVSAEDGAKPQTREHILLAKQCGIEKLIVCINKADLLEDEEMMQLIELEISELLEQYGYNVDDIPFLKVSAKGALDGEQKWVDSVQAILDTLDATEVSKGDLSKPFRINIDSVLSIKGRGEVCTGVVKFGSLKPQTTVDHYSTKRSKVTPVVVTSIEAFRGQIPEAEVGFNVGLLIRGAQKGDITRGDILSATKSLKMIKKIRAQLYLLTSKEGGRNKPIFSGFRPQAFINTADITVEIHLDQSKEMMMPGENAEVNVEFHRSYPLQNGDRFSIRDAKSTVGSLLVTEVIE